MSAIGRLARRGRLVLEAAPASPRPSERIIVRIYYWSEGGELLCTDSDPMTMQAAEKLKASLDPKRSIAVRVECYSLGEPRSKWIAARVVTMPAQAHEPDVEMEQTVGAKVAA